MSLRLIFMGTPHFAVPTLQALVDAGHQMVAVYTQPPKPKDRGFQVQSSPIHQLADQHHIPVFTPRTLKSVEEQAIFADLQPDIAIVAAYGLILPLPILQAPRFGCLNVHASLLPRWRGAAPINWAIQAGDTMTGVTIMQMDQGLDTGPIHKMVPVGITSQTTASALHDILAQKGAELMVDVLKDLETYGELIPQPQPEIGATYARKLTHDDGLLSWQESAIVLDRTIRAFNPWPGTKFQHKAEYIKVLEADLISTESTPHQPGEIVALNSGIDVACNPGILRLKTLQRPGKKALPALDFIRGYPLKIGDVLCPAIA